MCGLKMDRSDGLACKPTKKSTFTHHKQKQFKNSYCLAMKITFVHPMDMIFTPAELFVSIFHSLEAISQFQKDEKYYI